MAYNSTPRFRTKVKRAALIFALGFVVQALLVTPFGLKAGISLGNCLKLAAALEIITLAWIISNEGL